MPNEAMFLQPAPWPDGPGALRRLRQPAPLPELRRVPGLRQEGRVIPALYAITEADLQESIITRARGLGWKVYHTRDSRGSEPSFPDLVLIRAPRVIFLEAKTETGKMRKGRWTKSKRNPRWLYGQQEWLDELRACPGVETYLLRPSDLEWVYGVLE